MPTALSLPPGLAARVNPPPPALISTSVRLPPEALIQIDRLASAAGVQRGAMLRALVESSLEDAS